MIQVQILFRVLKIKYMKELAIILFSGLTAVGIGIALLKLIDYAYLRGYRKGYVDGYRDMGESLKKAAEIESVTEQWNMIVGRITADLDKEVNKL